MADPKKMAALAQLAQTGQHGGDVFAQAQGNLAASRGSAMSGMAADADLHGAPSQINGVSPLATYQATASSPYDNFASALTRDQSAYGAASSQMGSAVDQYAAQVQNARAATIADADRAISQAASRATSGSSSGKNPLTDADTKNIAQGQGDVDKAAQEKISRIAGDQILKMKNLVDKTTPAPAGATEDERKRAGELYDQQHATEKRVAADVDAVKRAVNSDKARQDDGRIQMFKERTDPGAPGGGIGHVVGQDLAREQWINQNAGSDRRAQEQSRVDAFNRDKYKGFEPVLGELGIQNPGDMPAAVDQFIKSMDLYGSPSFARRAAMEANGGQGLHPELGSAQEAYYRGMFPDMDPGQRTKALEEDNFNRTGAKNELDAAKQNKEANDLLGVPTGKETQSLKPEQAAKDLEFAPEKVKAIRSDPNWGSLVKQAEYVIKPPKDPNTGSTAIDQSTGKPYTQIFTVNDLTNYLSKTVKLGEDRHAPSPEMVQLLVRMYEPELKG